ncbi:queuine tRNA-ribosyltransferase [Platysternon megacephalum]|uniref:Queuine tRNA-ribosyltransferase n=1 Tax=Platysternon megacephalum TaxID=55544 RepID=A0A4D9DFJ1_9SAUR|nr:queuine tRNA-ribosyltransferase [Platysternon megacephalum]
MSPSNCLILSCDEIQDAKLLSLVSSILLAQPGPITEVDGAVATDFFTVLSIGQYYTEDQWLNMQAFSMLRKWLLCYGSEGANSPNSDDKSEVDGSIMSMVSATSTSSRLLPPKERLREKAFEYCQRLIEQSNRRELWSEYVGLSSEPLRVIRNNHLDQSPAGPRAQSPHWSETRPKNLFKPPARPWLWLGVTN